jgi:hypothetical protein
MGGGGTSAPALLILGLMIMMIGGVQGVFFWQKQLQAHNISMMNSDKHKYNAHNRIIHIVYIPAQVLQAPEPHCSCRRRVKKCMIFNL